MGADKAGLAWAGTTLLARTLDVLAAAVDGPLVVVGAPDRALPAVPDGVRVVADAVPGRGPLQGLATGLAAVRAGAAFVCATDLPFLHPAFVRRVLAALGPGVEAVLPHVRGHPQPLAAAYRTALAPVAAGLVEAGERRAGALARAARTTVLDEAALLADPGLAAADPDLRSVVSVDDPASLRSAREWHGRL